MGKRDCYMCGNETKKFYSSIFIDKNMNKKIIGYCVYGKKEQGFFLCRRCYKLIKKYYPIILKKVK